MQRQLEDQQSINCGLQPRADNHIARYCSAALEATTARPRQQLYHRRNASTRWTPPYSVCRRQEPEEVLLAGTTRETSSRVIARRRLKRQGRDIVSSFRAGGPQGLRHCLQRRGVRPSDRLNDPSYSRGCHHSAWYGATLIKEM